MVRTRHQDRRLKVFLRRHHPRHRSPQRWTRALRPPDDPPRHTHHHRLGQGGRTITDWGKEDGYFADDDSAEAFYNDLTWLCLHQHGAFNSPVWFNVGLYQQYGVGKDKGIGTWHWSESAGEAVRAQTQYEYPQGSACFIQGFPAAAHPPARFPSSVSTTRSPTSSSPAEKPGVPRR